MRRTAPPTVAAALTAVALSVPLAACGGSTSATTAGSPPATAAPATGAAAAAAPTCTAGQLRLAERPLAEGAGRYVDAWQVTDTGAACSLPAGRPAVSLLAATGRVAIRYAATPAPGPAPVALGLASGGSVWFTTEQPPAPQCTGASVGGGPFHWAVTLPGGAVVGATTRALSRPTLLETCPAGAIAVSSLSGTAPGA